MALILCVEDDADLQQVLDHNLRQLGHQPVAALCARDALRLAREQPPDLVLLDLMLPDLPGTEVCRALRSDPALAEVPVLVLTARADEVDRVVAFELGADDYVTKPFSVRELMLRVQAILRRGRGPTKPAGTIALGLVRVDRLSHRVWVVGAEVELTALEFKLLLTLVDRRDQVQARATLLADVWEIHAGITTRTVDTHVKRLREKLGPARGCIETVRGAGYRFAPAAAPGPG